MDNFKAWIGKKETIYDFSTAHPTAMMQAMLNQPNKQFNEVPHLYHWFYFLPVVDSAELAEDGHPKKGHFLPPIPFPKRMWAGGRLQFLIPIRLNQNIRRESEIINVDLKHGKSGDMYFVTVKHSIFAEDQLAIIEEHDIVYREATNHVPATPVKNETASTPKAYSYKKQFSVDHTLLFRYSAITFNAHRIHYDHPYATQVEAYPGLIVHGPLLATLLLHTFKQENPDKEINSFEFRAVSPVFDFDTFSICGDVQQNNAELWIEKSDSHLCMKAKVTFKGEQSCDL